MRLSLGLPDPGAYADIMRIVAGLTVSPYRDVPAPWIPDIVEPSVAVAHVECRRSGAADHRPREPQREGVRA